MATENQPHHPLHQFYHKNLHFNHRGTFLPMLCSRQSTKDVILPRCRGRARSFSNDPISPVIGCTGQLKKHNKISGIPILSHRLSLTPKSTTAAAAAASASPVVKYSKLKRLFSSKSFSSAAATATAATASSCGSRPRTQLTVNGEDVPIRKHRFRNENCVPISIENMDPPLPVIKRVRKAEEESRVDTLWERRSGGAALKSLQLPLQVFDE